MAIERSKLLEAINTLKRQKNAVLLGHYYAPPEVQDVCDFVGDSLGLSRQAAQTDADIILFCGVHFMAETASILAPTKKVLIPSLEAGCSLADGITGAQLKAWREANPDAFVIAYVNTTAEVKALTDCCCTSANAVNVVAHYAKTHDHILFVPDRNLGRYIQLKSGVQMELWDGACHVHDAFTEAIITQKMRQYPDAEVLVHPESAGSCSPEVLSSPRVFISSTTGMIARAAASPARQLIVVTEEGTLHKMSAAAPGKELILISPDARCDHMKHSTLEAVYQCLLTEQYEVKIPAALAERARLPIERMLAID